MVALPSVTGDALFPSGPLVLLLFQVGTRRVPFSTVNAPVKVLVPLSVKTLVFYH